jgi:hypothetical protein
MESNGARRPRAGTLPSLPAQPLQLDALFPQPPLSATSGRPAEGLKRHLSNLSPYSATTNVSASSYSTPNSARISPNTSLVPSPVIPAADSMAPPLSLGQRSANRLRSGSLTLQMPNNSVADAFGPGVFSGAWTPSLEELKSVKSCVSARILLYRETTIAQRRERDFWFYCWRYRTRQDFELPRLGRPFLATSFTNPHVALFFSSKATFARCLFSHFSPGDAIHDPDPVQHRRDASKCQSRQTERHCPAQVLLPAAPTPRYPGNGLSRYARRRHVGFWQLVARRAIRLFVRSILLLCCSCNAQECGQLGRDV